MRKLGYRHTQRQEHVKIQEEDGHMQAKERGLTESSNAAILVLDFQMYVIEAPQSVVCGYDSLSKLMRRL